MSDKTWTNDDQRKAVKKAAESLSDLKIFGAVIAIMENSSLYTPSHKAEARIIVICKTEITRRLADYDLATAQATGA